MPREYSAGAIIVRKDDILKYLLLFRKAQGIYREGWYLVRGLVEDGETEEQTVRREVREETGIDSLFFVRGFKEKVHWFYRNEDKETVYKEAVYFLAETRSKSVKLYSEHDDNDWLSFGEAIAKLKISKDKDVLKKANDFLELHG